MDPAHCRGYRHSCQSSPSGERGVRGFRGLLRVARCSGGHVRALIRQPAVAARCHTCRPRDRLRAATPEHDRRGCLSTQGSGDRRARSIELGSGIRQQQPLQLLRARRGRSRTPPTECAVDWNGRGNTEPSEGAVRRRGRHRLRRSDQPAPSELQLGQARPHRHPTRTSSLRNRLSLRPCQPDRQAGHGTLRAPADSLR